MRLLKFFGVSRSPSFKQLKYNALGYLKIMFNAPKLLVQSTKDIIPSSSSSSLKKKKKKTFLVPGNPSEFERDMEFATKQGLHVRINQERFLPPAESGGLRIDAYRERRAHRLNRRRIERDAIGNVIWSVEKKQEEIIKEKEEEEMANKIVYTKFIEYGSIREQPFAWVNEKTGIKEIVMWLGTPEERRNLAEREPVFPEIFMGPEILRPGEEFGFLDQWTLYHDSMVGGKSSGKLEILSNSRIRKEEGGKSKVDHDAPSVFRVIESWTRQDQESSYEKDRGVRKLSNLNVRSNITNRIFKLLDDAHFLGVTILRFSGKRIPSENKATQSEIRKAEEDDEVSVLSKLGKASRAERMEINMGETACMSGKSEEAISLREFDSFELICREIECDDEDLELEPNTDYPDETYIIAKAKLKNPDHEQYLTGKTKLYQVTLREREPVLEFEYFNKAYVEVPILKREVAKKDDVWCQVDLPFENIRRITLPGKDSGLELQNYYQMRTICGFGFTPQQDGAFQFELRNFKILQSKDYMSNERVLERLGLTRK